MATLILARLPKGKRSNIASNLSLSEPFTYARAVQRIICNCQAMKTATFPARAPPSTMSIYVGAVLDRQDKYNVLFFVDPVDDPEIAS